MHSLWISVPIALPGLIIACSHPIEIVGEGDVLSATGTRNCFYEDFLAGADSCTQNMVVLDYNETYYALARDGWKFEKWLNYCTDTSSDQCTFQLSAQVVKEYWGAAAPPLVAVFEKITPPPPEPVAVYSYELDAAGGLLNPRPLEGAHLKRKTVYFSFPGDYSKISFWCCKVPEGDEPHMPRVTDDTKPFVLRVDMGALADDGGLERELYADIFDSEGNYEGYFTNWTLEPKPTEPIIISEAGVYTIDYTVNVEIVVFNATVTLNIVDGANVRKINARGGANIDISGGKVESLDYCEEVTFRVSAGAVGSIDEVCAGAGSKGTISGGNVGSIVFEYSNLLISDGTIDAMFIWNGQIEMTGGLVESFRLALQNDAFDMTISGGVINSDLEYRDLGGVMYTFYGSDLTLTPPVAIGNASYQSIISGTLRDGTAISNRIICQAFYSLPLPPPCEGVLIVNEP